MNKIDALNLILDKTTEMKKILKALIETPLIPTAAKLEKIRSMQATIKDAESVAEQLMDELIKVA